MKNTSIFLEVNCQSVINVRIIPNISSVTFIISIHPKIFRIILLNISQTGWNKSYTGHFVTFVWLLYVNNKQIVWVSFILFTSSLLNYKIWQCESSFFIKFHFCMLTILQKSLIIQQFRISWRKQRTVKLLSFWYSSYIKNGRSFEITLNI